MFGFIQIKAYFDKKKCKSNSMLFDSLLTQHETFLPFLANDSHIRASSRLSLQLVRDCYHLRFWSIVIKSENIVQTCSKIAGKYNLSL